MAMATSHKKPRLKDAAVHRLLFVCVGTILGVLLVILTLGSNSNSKFVYEDFNVGDNFSHTGLPKQNDLSIRLLKQNHLRPRNIELYPNLARGHILIVLYVHNRPQYLKIVLESLSKVKGISETLLIVSHDGYFQEMDKLVKGITFCQVKQIYNPYSPHVFADRFPGTSPRDCAEKDDASKKPCEGNADQFGNYRSTKIVSLKHHWWWMMNTVWDGLKETEDHNGHILFIEEDHFIFPNAYRNLQILVEWKPKKCPDCYAANLAPCDVTARGEGWDSFLAEKMGNVGYSFNRTVWRKIHKKANGFCSYDDYNWDITMWSRVFPSFGSPVFTLRGPRTSAIHFGKCGLHQGQGEEHACVDKGTVNFPVGETDQIVNIKTEWGVHYYRHQPGYKAEHKGWGGWGDKRDHRLCLAFAEMYHTKSNASTSS